MILFYIPNNLNLGVIESQILNFIRHVAKFHEVVLIAPDQILEVITKNSNYNCVSSSNKKQIKYLLKYANWIYTRDIYSFYKMYYYIKIQSSKCKIYYDFRGLSFAESWYKHRNIFRKLLLFCLEFLIAKMANNLGAVSKQMKYYLIRHFKVPIENIYVMPCCIDSAILKSQVKKSTYNFVYVGGTSKWQRIEEILCLYKHITHSGIKGKLTIYTKEKEKIYKLSNLIGVSLLVKSLPHSQLIKELSSHDFGFLLREDVMMNNVASPIKFLEYTSNGVIPLLSNGIGDYSEDVRKYNLGLIVGECNTIDTKYLINLAKDGKIYNRLHEYSLNHLWENYAHHHPIVKYTSSEKI